MMRCGVEVEAITFLTHVGCDASDKSSCGDDPYPAAEKFGFKVKLAHLGQRYIDIVKNPRYGHGKNMNPCIDCRLVMLDEAKDYMEMAGGQFVITGEVLGQRPMSQRRFTLDLVAKNCGLEGRLVRPLSGRLLPPTVPEKEGLIKREWLLDIEGRSRKRQMALAEQFGLADDRLPQSRGGMPAHRRTLLRPPAGPFEIQSRSRFQRPEPPSRGTAFPAERSRQAGGGPR
jgi:hypothetical protein